MFNDSFFYKRFFKINIKTAINDKDAIVALDLAFNITTSNFFMTKTFSFLTISLQDKNVINKCLEANYNH